MNKNKLMHFLPILTLTGVLTYTWLTIWTTDYDATTKHLIGLGIFLIAAVLYFIKFSYGIVFTGLLLTLASFNAIAIFPVIVSASFFIKIGEITISTPPIQWKAILLLIFFFICTRKFWSNLYGEYRNRHPL